MKKIRKLEEKYDQLLRGLTADMEDLDFLEQVKPAEIADEDEKQIAENYLRKACKIRMEQVEAAIAQRIAQKKDIAYLNLLAREIVESGYDA